MVSVCLRVLLEVVVIVVMYVNMYICVYSGCGVVLFCVELKPPAAATVSTPSVASVRPAAVITPSVDTVMELPPIGGSPALESSRLAQKQARNLHLRETTAKPMLAQSPAAASPAMASRFSLPVFQQDTSTRYTSPRAVIADARSTVDSEGRGSSVALAVCMKGCRRRCLQLCCELRMCLPAELRIAHA